MTCSGPHGRDTASVHKKWVNSRCGGQQGQLCLYAYFQMNMWWEFPNYSPIYEVVWLGNLDVSHIKDGAESTANIQAHQPHTFREVTENLICNHNFNWEDWYSLSNAWFHLFQSTPSFCEQHTNVSCVGKLQILYHSTMFYSPLLKTSSSRSSLLIFFHVPQLPLILLLHSVITWTLH